MLKIIYINMLYSYIYNVNIPSCLKQDIKIFEPEKFFQPRKTQK